MKISARRAAETAPDNKLESGRKRNAANDVTKKSSLNRRRRWFLVFSGVGTLCLLAPLLIFYATIYRRNLAVARQTFPTKTIFTARDRLLIISPHPDDETLGVGGTIALARRQGISVRVAFLTNGDGSRSTQIGEDARRLRRHSFRQLAAMRQRETIAALKELGVEREEIVFLGYPDGGTQAMWQKNWAADKLFRSKWTGADRSPYKNSLTPNAPYDGAHVLRDVEKVIADFRPTVVFTTHPDDTHGDHWAAYSYTLAALERLRLSTKDWALQTRLLTFLVHHGIWPTPHGYHPEARLVPPADLLRAGTIWSEAPLDAKARAAKKAALESYVSQLALTPHYLRSFLRRNELFGVIAPAQIGTANSGDVTVLRDPVRDSLINGLWASGDIQSVSLGRAAGGNAENPTLQLHLNLPVGAPLSSRLSYRVALRAVSAGGSRAANVEITTRGSHLRATLILLEGKRKTAKGKPITEYLVTAHRVAGGLKVEMPLRFLIEPRQPASLLISVGAYLRGARLDQTGSGVARLLQPHRDGTRAAPDSVLDNR